MESTSKEGPVGGLPFFIAVSLLGISAFFLVLCTACRRKGERRLSSQGDPIVVEAMEPPASGGLALHQQQVRGRNSGEATATKLLHLLDEGNGTVSSCNLVIIPPRDLPRAPSMDRLSPEETYSNLNFPKRAKEMLSKSKMVVGDEIKDSCSRIDKIKEDVWGHQDQVEEMYSVVCKKKKRKKVEHSAGRSQKRASKAEASQGTAHPGPEGIAGYQSSVILTSMEPCYESIGCKSQANIARKQTSEPAYESVDIYWENEKQRSKLKEVGAAENLYESIENVAFRVQNRRGASHFDS